MLNVEVIQHFQVAVAITCIKDLIASFLIAFATAAVGALLSSMFLGTGRQPLFVFRLLIVCHSEIVSTCL